MRAGIGQEIARRVLVDRRRPHPAAAAFRQRHGQDEQEEERARNGDRQHRELPRIEAGEPRRKGVMSLRQSFQRSEEHTSELPSLMRNSYAVFCLNKTTKIKCPTKQTKEHNI